MTPRTWTSAPAARAKPAASRPIVPGPSTSTRDPVARPRCLGRPQRVGSRLDHRPGDVVDGVGQRVQRGDGHRQLLGQRSRPAAADPDLGAVSQTCWRPERHRSAVAAAEHRVAGDPPAEPVRLDALADRADDPAPLVTEAHRVGGMAVVQVGHVAGVELDVGAADADAGDVDDGLAGRRLAAAATSSTTHTPGPVMTSALMSRQGVRRPARATPTRAVYRWPERGVRSSRYRSR